jgi:hypothetical protein
MFVVAVALAGAAVAVALGFRSSSRSSSSRNNSSSSPFLARVPADAARITVSARPISRPVAPGFVGLSLEFTTVEAYAGTDPSAINPVLVALVRNLAPHQRPVLRIGGDSSDWGWVRAPGLKQPAGARFTLGQRWVRVTRALAGATDARLILGLNLEANSPRLMAVEARAFSGVGRRALAAFEIGNEPELFGSIPWYQTSPGHRVFGRRRGYRFGNYVREFTRFSKLLPASVPLAGPATGGPRWIPRIPGFLAAQPRARVATLHLYPLHRCYVNQLGPTGPSIPNLLSPAASGGFDSAVAPLVAPAHARGASLRVAETNSVSCGGAPGVSDTFASSLWALDYLFHLARAGVDGVNFHTFVKAYYRPFYFTRVHGRWRAHVEPMYYGLLAFTQAAPPGSRLVRVSAPADSTLRVWATRAPDHRTRVVLINTSAVRSRQVEITLPAGGHRHATVQRLSAPSLAAKTGVTLGGRAFAPETSTGHLTGDTESLRPGRTPSGGYLVRVPAGSAAILTR